MSYERHKLGEEIDRLSLDLVEWLEIATKGDYRLSIPVMIKVTAAILVETCRGKGLDNLRESTLLTVELLTREIGRMSRDEFSKEGSASGP